ncbi:Gfo/Idh/MocA family oxidoreductase [Spongiactinospora sp. TRM90649]|uniref:Gfo/Idh/MocA family oxidoreductase n=1 Tax=Spongiactinospora sp. TRM90649 TaxID=3031114 RepID=UPI0023F6EE07|nr:Gfo/Idh/MocA family oxidoreductase [Spongiactinospora sp. TRM90649]MDF5758124.1 Gfo/Idh/MocA family oxidoreductase [Spongiactinospora sp. TRM90649]
MGSEDVRAGLIGYGTAGEFFHAPLIAATPGMSLAAVVTRDAGRAGRIAAVHPGARVVDAAERLWELCDLIVVATPNRTHVPLATAALRAGLPVVVDKPLAGTSGDAAALLRLAAERGLMLTVFQNRRWDGDFRTLLALARSGELGEIRRLESRFERWRPAPKGGWRESGGPEEIGGLLYDLGSHLVDQALTLLGPVSAVYAESDARRPGVSGDDDMFIALTHANGARSHLWASAVAPHLGPRFRVLGSRAAYVKQGLDVQEERLRAGAHPDETGFGDEPPERWGVVRAGDESRRVPTEPGAYLAFYEGVVAALREGAAPPVDPADAVAALAVLEAARASAAGRKVVTLP